MNAQISALRARAIHQFDRMLTLKLFDSAVITRTESTLFTVGAIIVTAETLLSSAEFLLQGGRPPHKMQGDTSQISTEGNILSIVLKLGADSLGRMNELFTKVTFCGITTLAATAHGALKMLTADDADAASRMIEAAGALIDTAKTMVDDAECDLHQHAERCKSAAAA